MKIWSWVAAAVLVVVIGAGQGNTISTHALAGGLPSHRPWVVNRVLTVPAVTALCSHHQSMSFIASVHGYVTSEPLLGPGGGFVGRVFTTPNPHAFFAGDIKPFVQVWGTPAWQSIVQRPTPRSVTLHGTLVCDAEKYQNAQLPGWRASITPDRIVAPAPAPLVTAFTQRGWVFGLRNNGSTIRLTAGTNALDPVLSPNRSEIAYLTAVRGRTDQYSRPYLVDVWTVGTRANRQILVAHLQGSGPGALAWSPRGRLLAYAHDDEVAISREKGSEPTVAAHLGGGLTFGSQPAIAWSPDGRHLAVPLASVSPQQRRDLSIAITGTTRLSSHVIRVSFPAKLMGSQTTATGSHPDASQIGWIPDGSSLLVATTINGAGNSLTGIWKVPARGGVAHLAVGNPAGGSLRNETPALSNATHFLVSPNGKLLATDPGNRFWVAGIDGTHGRFLAPHPAVGCVISQYRWLIGSDGLAYVTLCTVGGTSGFRSTLHMLRFQNARPRSVVTLTSSAMDAISLAPPFRCAACG